MQTQGSTSYLSVLFAFVFLISFASCSDDDDDNNEPGYGQASINIRHTVGEEDLALNTGTYTNANGDTFQVSKLNYYLSHVELVHEDGSTYRPSSDYFIVRQDAPESKQISLDSIPEGRYTAIRFAIGIDSLTNMREDKIQEGALDPLYGMYWRWAVGYIFMKLEGSSPQADSTKNALTYHIGGSGEYPTYREVSLPLDQEVGATQTMRIELRGDIAEMFTNPNPVDFLTFPGTTQVGPKAAQVADNYARMFSVASASVE